MAVVAAGTAGAAAAYCAYTWYYYYCSTDDTKSLIDEERERDSSNEELNNSIQERGSLSTSQSDKYDENVAGPSRTQNEPIPPVSFKPTEGVDGETQRDVEAHLQHHFNSIQSIAAGTTIPSLLPALAKSFAVHDNLDECLERLRIARKESTPMTHDEKLNLWTNITEAALARLVAATWAVPLLSLQVYVELNILGRHLYLEAALRRKGRSIRAISSNPALEDSQLSVPSQEAFLSLSEYLGKRGLEPLIQIARTAAAGALTETSLDESLKEEDFLSIFSSVQRAFSCEVSKTEWSVYLLPPPEILTEILQLHKPDNRALIPGLENQMINVDYVDDMVKELRAIIGSKRFYNVAMVSNNFDVLRYKTLVKNEIIFIVIIFSIFL